VVARLVLARSAVVAAEMARVQLALNVSDLDEAVAFYEKLFQVAPAKRREGYANFAIADPPLKLVLFENAAHAGTLNHLGVEVESTELVAAATARLTTEGLACATEDDVACCYAVQDKVWVDAPDGEPWEIYTVLADVEMTPGRLRSVEPDADSMCCATAPESAARCCG
jgi:catechol 2,3-dioxygenase-like lactoylglutathione lyase family enzyme